MFVTFNFLLPTDLWPSDLEVGSVSLFHFHHHHRHISRHYGWHQIHPRWRGLLGWVNTSLLVWIGFFFCESINCLLVILCCCCYRQTITTPSFKTQTLSLSPLGLINIKVWLINTPIFVLFNFTPLIISHNYYLRLFYNLHVSVIISSLSVYTLFFLYTCHGFPVCPSWEDSLLCCSCLVFWIF